MQLIFEAVIRVPVELDLTGELAGATRPARIQGHSFDVAFPSFANGDSPQVVPPTLQTVRDDVDWRTYLADPWAWGSARSWYSTTRELISFGLHHLLFRATFDTAGDPNSELIEKEVAFTEGVTSWLTLLIAWLEVATGRPIRHSSGGLVDRLQSICWGFDGEKSELLNSRNRELRVTLTDATVNRWQFDSALNLANLGKNPPPECQYLNDARAALRDGDTRRCILDASTAAEIAMVKLLDSELAAAGEVIGDLVTSKWRQVKGLSDALRRFGIKLPKDIANTGLAEPRNRAIHSGHLPSPAEAKRAIEIASEVVGAATPTDGLFHDC